MLSPIAKQINSDLKASPLPSDDFNNPVFLAQRLDLFGVASSFVLRYRALWDKLMGVIVLIICPDMNEDYVSSNSKKKQFTKILKQKGGKWPLYALGVSEAISEFDNRFRTAEAHGAGKIRKLFFQRATEDTAPLIDLLWATNTLNTQMLAIKRIFDEFAEQIATHGHA